MKASLDPKAARHLAVFRLGGIRAPTRPGDRLARCPFCGHAAIDGDDSSSAASARHWFSTCPADALAGPRLRLSTAYSIDLRWWAAQPRCTAKSGWVTLGADPNPNRRRELAFAANEMGIAMVAASETVDVFG